MITKPADPTRTMATFEAARLVAIDFDGTEAQTFEPSPSGIGVNEAYAAGVETIFGAGSLRAYLASGGLHNRAPGEVVTQLARGAAPAEIKTLTSRLTEAKLSILLGEIGAQFPDGSCWPRPVPGFMVFREALESAQADGALLDDMVISSGHADFITKTHQVWGVRPPGTILATEVTSSHPTLSPRQLTKPAPGLMTVGRNLWRGQYGGGPAQASDRERTRILYLGDHLVIDGGFARASGVNFVHIRPEDSVSGYRQASRWLGLSTLQRMGVKYE